MKIFNVMVLLALLAIALIQVSKAQRRFMPRLIFLKARDFLLLNYIANECY